MREYVMTDQSAVLPLGLCGEHLACRIVWKFKDAWPDVADGTFQVLVRPSGYDAAYAAANVSADFDAGILSWTVTDTETAVPGFSSVQFVVLQGGRIIKQLTLRGYVGASLSGGDDTVELPVASAVNALLEEAARLAGNQVKDPHSALSFRHFVLGAIAIFFYVGIEVGIPNTANVHFSSLPNVGPALAGTMVGFYWFSMLIGRLVGASAGSKVSSKTMLGVMASVAIVFLLCAIFVPETVTIKVGANVIPLSLGFLVLCGLCTSIMWGAIFNLAVEGLGKYTAAASGIFMTLVCGGGIIPFFQNLLADHVGSMQSYWLIIACLAYLVYYALAGSKNVNKDIPVE